MKIETGNVYRVKHETKGEFTLSVQFADENFTTGMVVRGKVEAIEAQREVTAGGQVTVRNSFCEFKRVYISKGAIL